MNGTHGGKHRLFGQEELGSELVEYALCIGIWSFCVLAVFYGSFLLYADHYVALAAKQGARYAIVRGSTWSTACSSTTTYSCTASSTNITSFVQAGLPPGLNPASLNVAVSWPGTSATGGTCDTANGSDSPDCAVDVAVSYSFSFPLPFVSQRSVPLSASSQMNILE
jgi:hypothetical protein